MVDKGIDVLTVAYNGDSILGTTIDLVNFCLMNLNQSGNLLVSLIDRHLLELNQQYLIGDIGGNLIDQFAGLGEGALAGTFGQVDLFIFLQGRKRQ